MCSISPISRSLQAACSGVGGQVPPAGWRVRPQGGPNEYDHPTAARKKSAHGILLERLFETERLRRSPRIATRPRRELPFSRRPEGTRFRFRAWAVLCSGKTIVRPCARSPGEPRRRPRVLAVQHHAARHGAVDVHPLRLRVDNHTRSNAHVQVLGGFSERLTPALGLADHFRHEVRGVSRKPRGAAPSEASGRSSRPHPRRARCRAPLHDQRFR